MVENERERNLKMLFVDGGFGGVFSSSPELISPFIMSALKDCKKSALILTPKASSTDIFSYILDGVVLCHVR